MTTISEAIAAQAQRAYAAFHDELAELVAAQRRDMLSPYDARNDRQIIGKPDDRKPQQVDEWDDPTFEAAMHNLYPWEWRTDA